MYVQYFPTDILIASEQATQLSNKEQEREKEGEWGREESLSARACSHTNYDT